MKRFKFLILFLIRFSVVKANTYNVKIGTEHHVNVVDKRFLSFTVDPKYLFSSSEKYNSQESSCMASSLSPALIRIAGPSTAHMSLHNSTITFTDLADYQGTRQEDLELKVTNWQWRRFVQWVKSNGFDLVFAINNEEKMDSGLWDPNTAMSILTVAEKAGVEKIFWQLGYECYNQTIEEYLNDLETLRLMSETFPSRGWGVVGGDVSKCLGSSSHVDFKDYVTLSDQMLDAVFLQGNSSAQELERMPDSDRLKLLKRLSQSSTPLWLTESAHFTTPLDDPVTSLNRAADWLSSLGYSARNGFAVHFRELAEEELFEPTLSFYMALLYKNLVGERVLHVDLEASEAVLFAHCTSLRHKPVAGAVTLYGANMDEESARFAVSMTRREEGGDVLQFILNLDKKGNIVVNGRPMLHEGDLRPVVKRLRPYRTLLINLPPKSIGFWVLANTNVEACHNIDESEELIEDLSVAEEKTEVADKIEDTNNVDQGKTVEENEVKNIVEDGKTDENQSENEIDDREEQTNDESEDNYGYNKDMSLESKKNVLKDVENKEVVAENENNTSAESGNYTVIENTSDEIVIENHVSENEKSEEQATYTTSITEKLKETTTEIPRNKNEIKYKVVVDRIDAAAEDKYLIKSKNLKKGINNLNTDIKNVHNLLETKSKKINEKKLKRIKREVLGEQYESKKKHRKQIWKSRHHHKDEESKPKFEIIKKLLSWNPKSNFTKQLRIEKTRKLIPLNRNKVKRHLVALKSDIDELNEITSKTKVLSRKPRSLSNEHTYSIKNLNLKELKDEKHIDSFENEIEDIDKVEQVKLLKILKKIHEELKDLPKDDETDYTDYVNAPKDEDQIVVKTKLSDDTATVKYSEKSKKGLLKTTISNIVGVLTDLNKNLKNFWSAINILE